MKKHIAIASLGLFFQLHVPAQTAINPASAIWELTNPNDGGTGLTPSTAGQVHAVDEFFSNMEINGYTGPDNSQRVRIAGNEWPAQQTEQMDGTYIQFAISPDSGNTFYADTVSLKMCITAINNMKANLYYSTDPDFDTSTLIHYSTGLDDNFLPRDVLTSFQLPVTADVKSDETLYLRIYPWVHDDPDIRTGKYICLHDVIIVGHTEGVIASDPPVVETAKVTSISAGYAVSGGIIPSDGGSPVTARGVVWNTAGAPTVADNFTVDGEGSGLFISVPQNLTPGTMYHLRAYATNSAGTGYGNEKTFTTLDSVSVPEVDSGKAFNILAESAEITGNVTDWGGDTVTVRGFCWNTTGSPDTADNTLEVDGGLGYYKVLLYPLEESTTYYTKAYAVNSRGIGYGPEKTFATQAREPDVRKVVAQSGIRDYTSVQDAFNDVPKNYTGTWTIFVKNGIYKEKLLLEGGKINVVLEGESTTGTILTYDDYSGRVVNGTVLGTSTSYSVAIDASDFMAKTITFQNTSTAAQAVALRTNGDRQAYYYCHMLGYQDTYYTWGGSGTGRIYNKNCYIEGSVDFIFGRDIAVFDSCTINENRNGGTLTAASTEVQARFGYVFLDCKITHNEIGFDGSRITNFVLGRPWHEAPRTVFIRCEEPAALSPAGWSTWNVEPGLYAEYQCYGAGSDTTRRIDISRQLTDKEASEYTLENIFSRESFPSYSFDWLPENIHLTGIGDKDDHSNMPTFFALGQNYPNPFNPTTTIQYHLPKKGYINLSIHNVLGETVMTLVNKEISAGIHRVTVDMNSLPSGIYFYTFQSGSFHKTRKMMMLR